MKAAHDHMELAQGGQAGNVIQLTEKFVHACFFGVIHCSGHQVQLTAPVLLQVQGDQHPEMPVGAFLAQPEIDILLHTESNPGMLAKHRHPQFVARGFYDHLPE